MAERRRIPIPGSERAPVEGARLIGPPDKDRIQVTVVLDDGADPARLDDFAREFGLTVVARGPRIVKLAGTPADMARAFGVQLDLVEHPELGRFRRREGPVTIPAELGGVVHAVLGLDDRPAASMHLRVHPDPSQAAAFTPKEIAALYGFPTNVDGAGQVVGILELGGGLNADDLAAYWAELGISPVPSVTAIGVDGAASEPDGDADGEVMLDIEIVGAVASGAQINVYFAPNTDAGFLDALVEAAQACAVVSISWGSAEDQWTESARSSFELALQDAADAAVTVTAAAGDSGSGDGVGDGQAHVDFPAASAHILGCGGTKITAAGGALSAEVVWNEDPESSATGGGVSRFSALPDYQASAGVPAQVDTGSRGRGVPDVAGDADPASGYRVRFNGQEQVVGGTSAVAPLWAGLIALVNQQLGARAGFVNTKLYAFGVLRDVASGNNGAYSAKADAWDACTGLGSPDGAKVLAALGAGSSAELASA
jgi:kumamolisin